MPGYPLQEARDINERARQKRIARQIEPSGRQPLEEARADGLGLVLLGVVHVVLAAFSKRMAHELV